MTDAKAIEAAREAVLLEMKEFVDESLYAGGLMSDNMVDQIARAVIAAADKARAEGFDFSDGARSVLDDASRLCIFEQCGPGANCACRNNVVSFARRAFAAGLAKGRSEK